MKIKILCSIFAFAGILLLSSTDGFSYGFLGDKVNTACSPAVPYNGDCLLCHTSKKSDPTPAKNAYSAGGTTLTDYFCPPPPVPTCTDSDGDTYAVEGGDCGPVDCNDNDAAINPGATENCSDGFDNNCNDLIDDLDPAAVGCLVCTDNDGDGFAFEGGNCGPIDCDDSDASINPGAVDIPNNGIDENCDGVDSVDTTIIDNDGDGFTVAAGDCDDNDAAINPDAVEICTDGIDNDCNNLIDAQDPNAVDCPQTCFDNDGDTYAIDGGTCGPVDCDDNNASINPGVAEFCDDGIDNDCDGSIDEGCNIPPDCPDADGDGYLDAVCGGTDCNDNDAAINPGSVEIPGNGIDENCNGTSDDTILTCTDGSVLFVKKMTYKKGTLKIKGRASVDTTVTITNAITNEILADNIPVKGNRGKWKTKITTLENAPESITVTSSNGCSKMFNSIVLDKFKYEDIASSCPDDNFEVKKMKYEWGELSFHGRSQAGTTISLINDDTGEILADGIKTKGKRGTWKDEIENIFPAPAAITANSSDGCMVLMEKSIRNGKEKIKYQEVKSQNGGTGGNGDSDDDDDNDDDHDDHD